MSRWPTTRERFDAAVHMEPNTACWLWTGTVTREKHGYGRLEVNGKPTVAHRYAYEQFIGPIPPDCDLDHKCRTTLCVNPWHLEPVSHKENVLRGTSPAAKHAKQTHCKNGHPLNGPHVLLLPRSRKGRQWIERVCRLCREERRTAERMQAAA